MIVGTGDGAFANEYCLLGQAFDYFFQNNAWGLSVGMLMARTDLHIKENKLTVQNVWPKMVKT